MSNFEEQYTAWLDGALAGPERAEFEAALPDRAGALGDAAEWHQLRGRLREALVLGPMPHGDFVNSQVLAAIRREESEKVGRTPERGWFPVGRLAWTGVFLVAVAAGLSFLVLPRNGGMPDPAQFISQVVDARSADPKLGAYAFAAPGGKGAVLWINDAGFIPANESLK